MVKMDFTFLIVAPTASIAEYSKTIADYVNSGELAEESGFNVELETLIEPTSTPTPTPVTSTTQTSSPISGTLL